MMIKLCLECGVPPGELHKPNCFMEQCPECGMPSILCDCDITGLERLPWTGSIPGVSECREYNLYCEFVPGFGWYEVDTKDIDNPYVREDLNRLYQDFVWDKNLKKFIPPVK